MKKLLKIMPIFILMIAIFANLVACGENKNDEKIAESVELSTALLGEIEFENSEMTKLEQEDSTVTVSGTIDAMSKSQKNAFGSDDTTHVVALKFTFDKERTISSFTIKGDKTKVYSDEKTEDNYAGKISDLLDNDKGQDAFCYLVLSANTKEYQLISKYSDGTESTITLKIDATLATAKAD